MTNSDKLDYMIKAQKKREKRKALLGVSMVFITVVAVGIIQYYDIGKFDKET